MKQLNLRQRSAKFLATTLLFLFTLGFSQSALAYTINSAKVYYDPTAAGWGSGECTYIQIFIDKGDNSWSSGWGNSGMSMSHITNTNLWYWTGSWGDGQVSYLRFATTKSGDWGWYGGQTSWDRLKNNSACCGVDGGYGCDVNNEHKLFTSSGSSKGAGITPTTLSGYSDLNKQQTVKLMISIDGGSTYTEATTTWYNNTISASRYTMTNNNTATASQKNLAYNDNYASAVITSSITFTATADATNFTFKGWATDDQGPDDTNASYTYTVDGTKTIYAYFQEKTSLVTLVGCTEASVYAGPLTTGTATAKEPAGKEVTGFTKSGNEITFTGAMADKAISFNATAAGTVTATFAYKTPSVSHAGTASFQIGGAAIKLNPTYTDVAADATYTWSGTGVTFTPSADVANPNVSVETAGEYTITVEVSQGGKSASRDITLTASAYSGAECGTCFGHTAQ